MKLSSLTPSAPCGSLGRVARALLALVVAAALALSSRAAQPPPHHISAANLNVIQNDTGNTADSVTVTAPLSINDLRVRFGSNRGDYNVQVGDDATDDLANGMILTAISQNGVDNGELPDEQKNYAAPAFDGNANGYWVVVQDTTSSRAEMNINAAVAYFRYTNWLCGWARNATAANGGTNNLFTASPGLVLGTHFKGIKNGESRVDLREFGIYSTNSVATNTGVLLVNHAKNEGNYASSVANADGTWEIYVKDNFANGTSLEQDPTAFVFVPKTNNTVISGKFGLDATGTNANILVYSGNAPQFSVTNLDAGRYRLTIPGGSPAAGVLLVSSEGGKTLNFDNTVSYEADGNSWIIESRDLGTFPPPLEACTNEPVASFCYIPAATAGFTITPTNTLVTTEYGIAASFSVELDLAPTNAVSVAVSSSNSAEGLVSTNELIFNSTNWNIPQIVTITPQDDLIADGNISYTIVLAPAVSGDANYNGLDPVDVSVLNLDDEQASIVLSPNTGLQTTESGGSATFNVLLSRAPTADVVIGLTSGNLNEGTVAPASLTFTPLDWSTPQTVTVTGVDDFRVDGNKAYSIITAPAVSADLSYNGFNPADASVVNLDNDNAAVVYNYSALPLLVAEGATTNYSIVLTTQPDSNVVVTVTSANLTAGTVAPGLVTFTPADWNIPQVITISGVDNLVTNGSVAFTIANAVSSTDALYSNFNGTRTLQAVLLDNEVLLTLPSGDCYYGLGMPAIGIEGQASLSDVDATTYDNGSLTVSFLANGNTADRLEIRNAGTGLGLISVSGATVSYEGNVIGSYTGGLNLTPLVVSLNTNSTLPAVQQLIRSITFGTVTNGASLLTRTVAVVLDDGVGSSVGATKNIRVGALRLTEYQEGGDHGYGEYFGAADIALSEVGAFTPWPIGRNAAEGLLIDWPDGGTPNESQVLLRFDDFVGTNYWQVPSNAVVVSAELLININNTGDGGRFFRMLIPWDATNDTWSSLGDGVQADGIEAELVYQSQLGVEDGSGATGTGVISVGVTPDVQAWVKGTNNLGWVMKGWPLQTDGTGFSPSEASDVTLRPRLRVKWLMPQYAEVSFQQGVNDYTNTFDVNLRQANPDLVDNIGNGISSDWNDAGNTNTTQSLLRFDGIIGTGPNQIPPGSLIHAAVIELASTGSDAMGDGGSIHAVLQPWSNDTVSWNYWGGNGVQANGVEALVTPTALIGNSSLNPDVQGTLNTVEVTSDLQAWVNGERYNYGWAFLPWPNGSNAWISRSSEFVSVVDEFHPEAEHPRLRVYFTAGVNAVPAVLQTLTVTPTQVQVPFTGTVGFTYTVLRAPAVTGPWSSIGTATIGAGGTATLLDNAPLSGSAFYRVVYP